MDAEPTPWKERLANRGIALGIGAGLAFGVLGAGLGWRVWLKPQRDRANLRYESMNDVLKLYGLQTAYKAAHGTYADGLGALLSAAPDRDAIRARLAAHVDMNTVAVVAAGAKFKIEVNVLDGNRTLIKIKGPPSNFVPREAPRTLVETGQSAGADVGAPVLPPPAR